MCKENYVNFELLRLTCYMRHVDSGNAICKAAAIYTIPYKTEFVPEVVAKQTIHCAVHRTRKAQTLARNCGYRTHIHQDYKRHNTKLLTKHDITAAVHNGRYSQTTHTHHGPSAKF